MSQLHSPFMLHVLLFKLSILIYTQRTSNLFPLFAVVRDRTDLCRQVVLRVPYKVRITACSQRDFYHRLNQIGIRAMLTEYISMDKEVLEPSNYLYLYTT